MTDEEKACKAICDSIPCKTMCTKCKCYIAGFKAGRETEREYVKNNAFTSMKEQGLFPFGKWHDLRKDPNDLPDNGRRVLVKDKSRREYDVACLCRSKGNSDFWSYEHFISRVSDNYVIAWCEIPKFEE